LTINWSIYFLVLSWVMMGLCWLLLIGIRKTRYRFIQKGRQVGYDIKKTRALQLVHHRSTFRPNSPKPLGEYSSKRPPRSQGTRTYQNSIKNDVREWCVEISRQVLNKLNDVLLLLQCLFISFTMCLINPMIFHSFQPLIAWPMFIGILVPQILIIFYFEPRFLENYFFVMATMEPNKELQSEALEYIYFCFKLKDDLKKALQYELEEKNGNIHELFNEIKKDDSCINKESIREILENVNPYFKGEHFRWLLTYLHVDGNGIDYINFSSWLKKIGVKHTTLKDPHHKKQQMSWYHWSLHLEKENPLSEGEEAMPLNGNRPSEREPKYSLHVQEFEDSPNHNRHSYRINQPKNLSKQ